jgi:hypothetical protein
MIALVLVTLAPASGARAANPNLSLFPASANLFIGGPAVNIGQIVGVVPGGPGLGSFGVTYTYDPTLVSIDLAPGPLLGSTGRTVSCATSRPFATQSRIACTSTGAQPGATGSGVLVNLTVHQIPGMRLRADGNSDKLAVLDTIPQTTSMLDVQAQPLVISRTADVLITVRALQGDVTANCVVDIYDEQAILGRFGVTPGDLLYSTLYDLIPATPDGQINAFDLQFVMARVGSTCDAPVPPEPPQTVNPDDVDDDNVSNGSDNCPTVYNPDQTNTDGNNAARHLGGQDLLGDACDSDADGDGYTAAQEAAVTPPKSDLSYCKIMRADVDGDGVVSILDLTKVAANFAQAVPPAPARNDQDGDNVISIQDIARQAAVFTQPVTACP